MMERHGEEHPARGPQRGGAGGGERAILGLAGQRSVDAVLQHLVAAARELVGATYAALGTPDAKGDGFARFITAGMSDDLIDAIGSLPRTHGLLGSLLVDPSPYRSDDVGRVCSRRGRRPRRGHPRRGHRRRGHRR